MKPHLIVLIVISSLFACVKDPVTPNNSGAGGTTTFPASIANIYTTYSSEDWDNWTIQMGDTLINVYTAYPEDWDNWDFSMTGINGDIKTVYSEDWDNWRLTNSDYTINIRTAYSNDWDNWDIDDYTNNWHVDVQTAYAEDDWDSWKVCEGGSQILNLNTSYADDNWDSWKTYGSFQDYPMEYRLAILFVPIFISSLHQQGIVE